ncbi:Inosine-uridine preferring nucleoside hydrolase [Staphylococcus pseudintermedius]|nr:Inosine-uridine preferring nucleoside hydrolase [Staphylococcus pseudintermedius]
MPIPIIIDTDPGIDDAAAISLALHHPQLDVQLISTVHGNVPLQRTTRNAQQLIEHFHAHVPVASGAASPLVQKAVHALMFMVKAVWRVTHLTNRLPLSCQRIV